MGVKRSFVQKLIRRVRRYVAENLLFQIFWYMIEDVWGHVFKTTLPVMQRLFSRYPNAPNVIVKDARANRVKLEIEPRLTSPFNVEKYEIAYSIAEKGDLDVWHVVGVSEFTQRTVPRLEQDREYKFRVRARNIRGSSEWSDVVIARTKQRPVNGGGTGDGYVWSQTATEITIAFKVHRSLQPNHVSLHLTNSQEQLMQLYVVEEGQTRNLLNGSVPKRVKRCSQQIMEGQDNKVLVVTLEKSDKSLSTKFDFWRSVVQGQPEIDTHMIEREWTGKENAATFSMDGGGLRHRMSKSFIVQSRV
ncbi:hypothetical protein BSKO_06155 [Bryopsis sp. KO-2023]|nr:hypothetical protein BSKO_06155 [Bryopsis sp. KO-2023]